MAGDVRAQPTIASDERFRIASWNLEDAAAAGVVKRAEPKQRGWRNTFGAERRLETATHFDGRRLGADVVLLQGVRIIKEVRKIFPARDWKVIVSRQILRHGKGQLNRSTTLDGKATATAIAVRYQRALRVTAVEHLLDLGKEPGAGDAGKAEAYGGPENDTGEPATGKGADGAGTLSGPDTANATAEDKTPPGAGLAVRIVYRRSPVWAVSALLPPRCSEPEAACPAATALEQWAEEKRRAGFGVVVAGQLAPALRKDRPRSACASQELVADASLNGNTGADSVAGCMTFVEFDP